MTICTTIGIVSTKGGVGKTSTTAALGAFLADIGQRVLLVDCEFQQSLSNYYLIEKLATKGIRELITSLNPDNCISKTDITNLDIVISNDPKGTLRGWLKESTNNIYFLKAALHKVKDDYDFIVIDSQGSTDILQEAIILASDLLISPIVPEALDIQEFWRGTVEMVKGLVPPTNLGIPSPPIPPLYSLLYKMDRTADAKHFAGVFCKQILGEEQDIDIRLLNTAVPNLSAYSGAAARHTPVHKLEKKRSGPTPSALEIYSSIVTELFPELKSKNKSIPLPVRINYDNEDSVYEVSA